jgi:hypothetical protein
VTWQAREPARHGGAVDDRADEHLGGRPAGVEGGRAVGRRDHDPPACDPGWNIFERGVAKIEAVDPQAAALAPQEHRGASPITSRQFPSLLDREHRPDTGRPVGQGRDDRRGSP